MAITVDRLLADIEERRRQEQASAPVATPTPTPTATPTPTPTPITEQARAPEPTPTPVRLPTVPLAVRRSIADQPSSMGDVSREVLGRHLIDQATQRRVTQGDQAAFEPVRKLIEASQQQNEQAGAADEVRRRLLEAQNKAKEQAALEVQRQQTEQMIKDFSPNEADPGMINWVERRHPEIPDDQIQDYTRRVQGINNARRFSESIAAVPDEQKAQMAPLAAGLIKEGLPAQDFRDVVSAWQSGDKSVYDFPIEKRQAANRVLGSLYGTQGPQMVSEEAAQARYIPESKAPTAEAVQASDEFVQAAKAIDTGDVRPMLALEDRAVSSRDTGLAQAVFGYDPMGVPFSLLSNDQQTQMAVAFDHSREGLTDEERQKIVAQRNQYIQSNPEFEGYFFKTYWPQRHEMAMSDVALLAFAPMTMGSTLIPLAAGAAAPEVQRNIGGTPGKLAATALQLGSYVVPGAIGAPFAAEAVTSAIAPTFLETGSALLRKDTSLFDKIMAGGTLAALGLGLGMQAKGIRGTAEAVRGGIIGGERGELTLPTRTLADVERGPDIVYSSQSAADAADIVGGIRDKPIWTANDPTYVRVPEAADGQVMAFRVREGAEPVAARTAQGVKEVRTARTYRPSDLTPVSRLRPEDVFDPDVLARARNIPETARAAEAAPAPALTPDAEALLKKTTMGAPSTVTSNMARIARENGIDVTDQTRPQDIIDALRAKKAAPTTAAVPSEESAVQLARFKQQTAEIKPFTAEAPAPEGPAGFYRVQGAEADIRAAEQHVEAVRRATPPSTPATKRLQARVQADREAIVAAKKAVKAGTPEVQRLEAQVDRAQTQLDHIAATPKKTLADRTARAQARLKAKETELDVALGKADKNVGDAQARLAKSQSALAVARASGKAGAVRNAERALAAARKAARGETQTFVKGAALRTKAARAAAQREAKMRAHPTVRNIQRAAAEKSRAEALEYTAPYAERIRAGIRVGVRAAPARAEAIATQRAAKTAELRRVLGRARGKKEILRAQGVLKGKFETPGMLVPEGFRFTPAEEDALYDFVDRYYLSKGRDYSALNSAKALEKLLPDENGISHLNDLAPHELKYLGEVFGDPLLMDIGKVAKPSLMAEIWDVINLPRVLQAGVGDWSYLGRQGMFAMITQNKIWRHAAADYAKSFASKDAFLEHQNRIFDHPLLEWSQEGKTKLFLPGLGGGLTSKEEILLGRVGVTRVARTVQKVELINMTTRGAEAFLDDLRMGSMEKYALEFLDSEGRHAYIEALPAGKADILRKYIPTNVADQVRAFVNETSGRAGLGKLEAQGPFLSALFYAPRFVVSRVAPLRFMASGNPVMRKIAIREFARFFGTGTAALGVIKLSGLGDVELDPRSSDFAKIRIGPTRLDPWAGGQPLIRYASQMMSQVITGKGAKQIGTGKLIPIDVMQAAKNFIRSKFSPTAGLVANLYTGKTFIGEELRAPDQVWNLFVPLFVQDMVESTKAQHGPLGAGLGFLSWAGIGVQSYWTTGEKLQQAIDQDVVDGNINLDDPWYKGKEDVNSLGDLSPADRDAFETRWPNLVKQLDESTGQTLGELGRRGKAAVAGRTAAIANEQAFQSLSTAADIFRKNPNAPGAGETFRRASDTVLTGLRGARSVLDQLRTDMGMDPSKPPEANAPQVQKDLYDYFSIFDKYPNADVDPDQQQKMFADIESFMTSIGAEREAEIAKQTGINMEKVPEYAQLKADRRTLRDSGFFDRADRVWAQIQADRPNLRQYATPDDYQAAKEAELAKQYGSARAGVMVKRDAYLRTFDRHMKRELDKWRRANPKLILIADKWGYRDITRSDLALLSQQ